MPASPVWGVSVWPAIEPGPPWGRGAGPPELACHRPPAQYPGRASEPGTCPVAAQPLCSAYPPPSAALRRGRGHPGSRQAAALPLVSSPRPVVTAASHPGSRSRHSARPRDAVNQQMEGRGRVPLPVYLACTCGVLPWTWPRNSRPAANLTAPAPGAPGSWPGPGRCLPGPGHWQVHGGDARSTEVRGRAVKGRSQVCARSMAAGYMGFRTRPLPVTRSPQMRDDTRCPARLRRPS